MRRLYFPILIMIGWLVSLAGCASSPGPQPSIASSGPSAPATVSRYPYAVDSFYTFNGDLVHMWQDWNSNEQTREIWPLSAIGKPAVVVRNSSQVVTVLFRTSNGGLQEMSFVQDQGWSQPTELVTSNVSSDPAAAVTPDNNHQAVVWVDTTGTLYQRLWDEATGGWQPSSSIMANIRPLPPLPLTLLVY